MATRQANVMRWLFIVVLVVLLQLLVAYRQEDELEQLMALVDEENTSQDLTQGDHLQKSGAQNFVALHDVGSVGHGVRGPCTLQPFEHLALDEPKRLSKLQPCSNIVGQIISVKVEPGKSCTVNCQAGFSMPAGKKDITCGEGTGWDIDPSIVCKPCHELQDSCPTDGGRCRLDGGHCQPDHGAHVHELGNSCKLILDETYPKELSKEQPCSDDHYKKVNKESWSALYIIIPDSFPCQPICQGNFKSKDYGGNPPVCSHEKFTPPIECIPK